MTRFAHIVAPLLLLLLATPVDGQGSYQQRSHTAKAMGHMADVACQLQLAVAAGRLTPEQAWSKWSRANQEMMKKIKAAHGGAGKARRGKVAAKAQGELAKFHADLSAAVRAGKLSKGDAQAKLDAAKKKLAISYRQRTRSEKTATYANEVAAKLAAAVKAGKMSKRDAQAKLKALKLQAGASGQAKVRRAPAKTDKRKAYLRQVARDLEAAVKAGKMSKQDARARWEATKQKLDKQPAKPRRWL